MKKQKKTLKEIDAALKRIKEIEKSMGISLVNLKDKYVNMRMEEAQTIGRK